MLWLLFRQNKYLKGFLNLLKSCLIVYSPQFKQSGLYLQNLLIKILGSNKINPAMNFFEQFESTSPIFSLTLVSSPKNSEETTGESFRTQRPHSLFQKINRSSIQEENEGKSKHQQSRSIQKILLPKFTTKQDQTSVILYKMSQRLGNKVRKLQFQFMVRLENFKKEPNLCSQQANRQGAEKLAIFIESYENKYLQNHGIDNAFKGIKCWSRNHHVSSLLTVSIGSAVGRQLSVFMKNIKKLESSCLKVEMLVDIIKSNALRKHIYNGFIALKDFSTNQSKVCYSPPQLLKKQSKQGILTKIIPPATAVVISKKAIKALSNVFEQEIIVDQSWKKEETTKMVTKQISHKLVENFPQQYDNTLFVQNLDPFAVKTAVNLSEYFTPRTENLIKKNPINPHRSQQRESKEFDHEINETILKLKININDLYQEQSKKKNTSKRPSICEPIQPPNVENENNKLIKSKSKNSKAKISRQVASMFHQNDIKLNHLQNKLFNQSSNRGDRYGSKWKNDRDDLNKILSGLKSTAPVINCESQLNSCKNRNNDDLRDYFVAKKDDSGDESIINIFSDFEEQIKPNSNINRRLIFKNSEKAKLNVTCSNKESKPSEDLRETSSSAKQSTAKTIIPLKNKRKHSISIPLLQQEAQKQKILNSRPGNVRVFQPSDWKKLYLKEKMIK